jgi:hypothetical protein
MTIWYSLEQRFAAFDSHVPIVRRQFGKELTFRPGGSGRPQDHIRFDALATIAGIHLGRLDSRLGLELPLQGAAPEVRWCEALFDVLKLGKSGLHGWGVNDDGTPAESFSQMDLADAAGASVALCLHLEALEALSLGLSLTEKLASPRYNVVRDLRP